MKPNSSLSHLLTLFILIFVFPADVQAQWEADVRLTDDPNYSSTTSNNNAWCITTSGDTVHVGWYESRDGNFEIYYNRSLNAGQNWESNTRLTYDDSLSWYPSIASSGTFVHVVWQDNRDGWSQGGLAGEIYYRRSNNGGTTWEGDVRVTPNNDTTAAHPSLAVSGSTVHVVWMDQRDNWEIYYKRNPTGNGIEESKHWDKGTRRQAAKVIPNPFTSFAMVSGCESECFAIYDISGRLVRTYKGNRIGADLAPGVYFAQNQVPSSMPVRIVKVR